MNDKQPPSGSLGLPAFVGDVMKSTLARVTDWEGLTQTVRYNVRALAAGCGVTVRQLERYFLQTMGQSPHHWLHALRMRRAVELLRDGTSAKATAAILGYKGAQHFNHDFKKYYGTAPGEFSFGLLVPPIPPQMSRFDN